MCKTATFHGSRSMRESAGDLLYPPGFNANLSADPEREIFKRKRDRSKRNRRRRNSDVNGEEMND